MKLPKPFKISITCILASVKIIAQSPIDSLKSNAFTSESSFSVTRNANQKNVINIEDKSTGNIMLNWELSVGQTHFVNPKAITSRNHTIPQPIGFAYYFSISQPIIRNYDRFGAKLGVGPHLKTFGINKLIGELNNKLTFTDIHDSLNIKASLFQQVLVDMPLSLYCNTKSTKRGRFLSLEWGLIPGIEVNNKWKTYSEDNSVITGKFKEDIFGTQKFQFGNSLKISYVKNRGALSSRIFIQGIYYSTNVFKQSLNSSTQNYEVKFGIQITANQLRQNERRKPKY